MKKITILLFLTPAFLLAQSGTSVRQNTSQATGNQSTVKLICKKMLNCTAYDSLTLYEPEGLTARVVARAGKTSDSLYVFNVPGGKPKIYGVGVSEFSYAKVVLGEEPEVTVWGDCAKFNFARAVSPANNTFRSMNKRVIALLGTEATLKSDLTGSRQSLNEPKVNSTLAAMKTFENTKKMVLDSLRKANPLYSKVAALYLVPEYEVADDKAKFASQFEFYGKEYFRNCNLSDPAYNDIPDVIEAFKNYASLLAVANVNAKQQQDWSDAMLARFPSGSRAYKMAFSGIMNGYQVANSPNYNIYAQRYINEFKGKDRGEVRRLEAEMMRNNTFTPGLEVPELVGQTPAGGNMSLTQTRGKYVLLDFWASWCGPCRRENPNVKANYEKYKSKGFEVFGVSLDTNKDAWLKAIEADGLQWLHISDLKGWQSDHAKLYSVSSIPQTLLLDPQGKLIMRNIRGEALGEKLKEIFGE